MSYDKFPDRLSRPMSRGQAATLRTLSVEAYQPKLFDEKLTREEADRRIEATSGNCAGQLVLSPTAAEVVRSASG
jgi:hypothetical protein